MSHRRQGSNGGSMRQAEHPQKKWLVLLAVVSAFSYTFISRYVLSPLMADVSSEFSLTSAQAGIYMSAFFLGYIITQVPGGILADRVSPRIILVSSALVIGASTAMMAYIPAFQTGIVYRLITGLASGFVFSCCSKVVSRAFSQKERGVALGILMASPPLGITLASLAGPILKNLLGWRQTFLVVGLYAVLVAAMLFLFIRDGTDKTAQPQPGRPSFMSGLLEFIRDRNQWLNVLGGFMFMLTTTGFPTWVNGFTRDLQFGQAQTTVIAMGYSLAGIAGSVLSGLLANRLKMNSRRFLMLSLSLMAVLSLLLAFRWGFVLFAGIGILYGFVSYLPASHFAALAIDYAKPEFTGTSAAVFNLLQQTASVIQPVFLGASIDMTGGFTIIWYVFTFAMALAVAATYLSGKREARGAINRP